MNPAENANSSSPAGATPPRQLVYVTGSGHSGSTLLDMLLAGHSRISCLGEASRIYLSANKSSKPHLCTCGRHVLECPFWRRISEELRKLSGTTGGEPLKELITTNPAYLEIGDDPTGLNIEEGPEAKASPIDADAVALVLGSALLWRVLEPVSSTVRLARRIARDSHLIFEAARNAFGTPIIVDSTKTPGRMKALYLQSSATFRLLHLVRDGRAVALSRMRRHGLPMEACARVWRNEQLKIRLGAYTIPKRRILRVRYEDLCREPEGELLRICRWLQVDFEPAMLTFREDRHNVGGNPMRWRESERRIRLDERWRRELSKEDLGTFDRIAGRWNRKIGYPE